MTFPAKVLVVDHDVMVGQLISNAIRDFGYRVATACSSVSDAFDAIRRESPDVLVVETNVEGPNTSNLIPTVRKQFPRLRIIVLTGRLERNAVERTRSLGCDGFLSKTVELVELQTALRTVASGRQYFSSPAVAPQNPNLCLPATPLTRRQHALLRQLQRGETQSIIAKLAGTGIRSTYRRVRRLKEKLGICGTRKRVDWAKVAVDVTASKAAR